MKRPFARAALAAVSTLVLAGCGATSPAKTAPACQPSHLKLSGIGRISSMTGEDGFQVLFGNSGPACTLSGYPTVSISDHSGVLPFRYQKGGGPYFEPSLPTSVTVPGYAPRLGVEFEIAKYRCDQGVARTPTQLEFALPGGGPPITLDTVAWSGNARLDYCKGGSKDPGQLVYVNHAQRITVVPEYITTS
jgi:hypothetical protein